MGGDPSEAQRTGAAKFQFHAGRTALIGVGVMVLVSGYTTGKGFLDVVGWSQFFIVAMGTIVVQSMLAMAAWFLGQEIARWVLRKRLGPGMEPPSAALSAVTAALFVATFCLSAFFSFSFWFTELRSLSQRAEDARQLPNTFQTAVMLPVHRAVDEARAAELRGISEFDATRRWFADLDRIAGATRREARGEIQRKMDELRRQDEATAAQARDAQQRLADRIWEARTKLADARRRKTEAEQGVRQIDARLAPFEPELAQKRREREEHEQEARKEEAGIEGRIPGCGPLCQVAQRRRDEAQRRIDEIERPLQADRKRRGDLERQLRDADGAIEEQTRVLAGLGASGGPTLLPDGASSDRGLPRLEQLEQSLTQLASRRRAFVEAGTAEAYRGVVEACGEILGPLIDARVAIDALVNLSCESSAVLLLTQNRPQRERARAEFESQCAANEMTQAAVRASELIPHGQQRVPGEVLGRSFDQINAKVQSCINLAGVTGADVSPGEKIRADFARTSAPDRDRFQETLDGLWDGGAHRTAALGIAVVFDLIILALSFFAEVFNIRGHAKHRATVVRRAHIDTSPDPGDPIPLAGAKALRRHARYDVKLRRSIVDLNAPEITALESDARENAFLRVDGFLQAGLADQLNDGRYALSDAALGELEGYVDEQGGAARKRGAVAEASAAGPSGASGATGYAAAGRRAEPARVTPLSPPRYRRQASDFSGLSWPQPVSRPAQPAAQAAGRSDQDTVDARPGSQSAARSALNSQNADLGKAT